MLTQDQQHEIRIIFADFTGRYPDLLSDADIALLHDFWFKAESDHLSQNNEFGIHPLTESVLTAQALCDSVSPDRNMILAILLHPLYSIGVTSDDAIGLQWGEDVLMMTHRLDRVASLYGKKAAVTDENFSKLLMAFAQDIRVIIITILDRLVIMRAINHHPSQDLVKNMALEAALLYAPIAHRLGLYKIKGELEDLSLKYSNREIFTRIARKLKETKSSRDKYIADFIKPVKEALEAEGLKFEIKGRTKSIYSIWNKMRKQNNDVENIYDLFAIRIILDLPPERERRGCWTAYSIVADMFQPNPARFKDWLTIPKSNGYESLHTTVSGPGGKWVEVQIRSKRMDEIAEKGVAAHWKYKGLKSANELDLWMARVREILETADQTRLERMKGLDMDLYSHEIYVFTPKGDLYKLPEGASVLDFAFSIHSGLGCKCIGAKVNDTSRKINFKLKSGDTVEILTSSSQQPKLDWLNMVVTSKARNKIRQTVKENENKASDYARELLQRRFKNRKIELDESLLMKLIKRLGFKSVTEFYSEIAGERLDINHVISSYEELDNKKVSAETVSAEEFSLNTHEDDNQRDSGANDVVIIGENISGISYKLAKCCNPIYGDDVFGFISAEGVIKIHRTNCPNAANIRDRYPYRLIPTRWSGKAGSQFQAVIKVVGQDDIGIVTNISSIINKEPNVDLRRIDIQSQDGTFHGVLALGVRDLDALGGIIKKIRTVKGVNSVTRSNG